MARARLRNALFPLLFGTLAALTAPARAQQAAPLPADRAVLAGEDKAQGTDIPVLNEPMALGGLTGRPIVRIDVAAQGGRWPVAKTITSIELGEKLTAEAARRGVRELLAGGSFARASVEAYPVDDGVGLRLAVLPRRLVATIQLTGGVLETKDTLDAAGVADESEITAPMLPDLRDRIRAFYVQHGYPAATVAVDAADTDDPSHIVLSIDIKAGAPRTVSQRVFVIDPRADQEVGPLKTRYRFDAGARVDEPAFVEADRELADLLRQNSFHGAQVLHKVLNVGPNSYLYVYVKPGPRVVPVFNGNRAFDDDALTAALDLRAATDTKAADLAERVRTFYRQRGFFDVEVTTPAPQSGDTGPVQYLAFQIREHEQVRVTKRIFPCLTGDLSADDLGKEIETFLEEDLPGAEILSAPDPRLVTDVFGPTQGSGGRARLLELNPSMTWVPATYERALKHIRELYFSKGYLNAVVGPPSVLRATCSGRSATGACIPEPPNARVEAQCQTDALNLPILEPPVPESLMCRPDPARHIECAPEVTLRIPIHLGPQTVLYDVGFEGNKGFCGQSGLLDRDKRFCAEGKPFSEQWLNDITDLTVGQPLSNLALDAARLRVQDAYRNLGYAFSEVRTVIEPSPDRTRARARFVISERDRVNVTGFVIKGATRTEEGLIRRRVLLREGAPFRQEQARLSEERIATLGTFSSVSISLEDPEVPQKDKRVIISVVEQLPQYLEPQIGFSTGDGIRFAFEYGHRNIAGLAIALSLRIQLNYLFEFMISDEQVRKNYDGLNGDKRLERRVTGSLTFPEIGLGPLVSLSADGVHVRDNQRDYGLTKFAAIPSVTYRPRRAITTQVALSTELNDVDLFQQDAQNEAIRLLRVPFGRTIAIAQRVNASWDARDNPFAATKGFLIAAGAEHVNALPLDDGSGGNPSFTSHFIRFTGRVAGYLRLVPKSEAALALSLSGGYNLQLNSASRTYPDRLFFMGGVDSLRSYLEDELVPQDLAERITDDKKSGRKDALTIAGIPIRGGDVVVNPRAELRLPITDLLQIGIFLDAGNVWFDPGKINLNLRYAVGAGLRITTPIGPLALDYGFNLFPREWEDSIGAFHFSIGLF